MALTFLDEFAQPGAAYRGKPFWAWNGKLEPDELRRQIRVMQRMGLGGFFMHSRVGLDTDYLSDDWFACVDACIDEAKQLKMEAWLYDEDRWPSGAAGGLVTQDPRYRMRSLMVHTLTDASDLTWDEDTVAVFTAKIDDDQATDVMQLATGTQPDSLAPGQVIVKFVVELAGLTPWYNGYTYLDTLNHEAVREFIRVTHEAYLARCGEHFGKCVPGIFTDEPNYGTMQTGDILTGQPNCGIVWTGALPATFAQRYGYDLIPHLVELIFDVDGQQVSQARYHYHDCATFLFVDAFARQIGEWCAAQGIDFTGHVLAEDSLSDQTNVVGNCMRFYEHMQAPGMDLLTEHWRIFNTAKQVSSAARQFGRKWRLTETYGCTGWDFPFAGHKALGDWQVALGINLRCQHLSWYTMQGEAKRDYPAAIFYQSPWWEYYAKVEDYFARILAVMTRGSEVRDLLVLHPVESMWLLCKRNWLNNLARHAYDQMFTKLSETLLAGHVDFDFGDEELLSRHGSVRMQHGMPELVMGEAAYRVVLVPPMTTMRASTLALLQAFRQAGGQVVFAGEPAAYVDAQPSTAVGDFAVRCVTGVPANGPVLVTAVEGTCRRISITDSHGQELAPALYLLREDADAYYLFVCNTGDDFANGRPFMDDKLVRERTTALPDVMIRGFADCAGTPLLLDPETGNVSVTDAVYSNSGWEIRTALPALASRLYVIPRQAVALDDFTPVATLQTMRTETLAPERWPILLTEQNNLVLDRPRYRIGEGAWQPETEILRVDRAVRAAMGVPARGGNMVQPWMARRTEREEQSSAVTLAYAFTADTLPSGALYLALEQPQTFCIMLNGQPVSTDADAGWWVDRSLRLLPLNPAFLHLGENALLLECDYRESHSGLEIMYLLGQFGTKVQGERVSITTPPTALTPGDWCAQGLAFYSGNVVYQQPLPPITLAPGERIFVQIPAYRGIGVRVLVNGTPAGIIGWEPNEVEITHLVSTEPMLLQIEVIGHRRNSHGPHHLTEQWPVWTGPGEYQADGDRWFEGYQLVPCGLMVAPQLVIKQ